MERLSGALKPSCESTIKIMERDTNVKTCLKEWHKHPFSWLIVLFGMGYGVFYVMVRYLFRANGIGVIFVSIILGILLVLVNWLLWKSVAFHFCPKKDTALDALDILALYKAWGMHVLLYMIWFIPVWPALLIIFIWYWGWQHKYNVRLGCTCPKCGEISLKSLSDAESDPLLYESDCTELEKGIADIRYYRCSSCGYNHSYNIRFLSENLLRVIFSFPFFHKSAGLYYSGLHSVPSDRGQGVFPLYT